MTGAGITPQKQPSIQVRSRADQLQSSTLRLLRRMLSPLCGIDTQVAMFLRGAGDPRFVTAGAGLTGVHVLQGLSHGPNHSYHIGGGGIFVDEAMIRALAESLERYSQLVAGRTLGDHIRMATLEQLQAANERTIDEKCLTFFTPQQLSQKGFPFKSFRRDATMGWIHAGSLVSDERVWVPAQLTLLGYAPSITSGEPSLLSAVTTGTAAHTEPLRAVRNALLEAIQVDAIIGHWYTDQRAKEIAFDRRTVPIERLVRDYFDSNGARPSFYFLPSADLPGHVVACVIRAPGAVSNAIGVGSDLSLVSAMYKAMVEATGVLQLAKFVAFHEKYGESDGPDHEESELILDLDRNVAVYSSPQKRPIIDAKFGGGLPPIPASDLPEDTAGDVESDVRQLIDGYRKASMELVFMDLTTVDIRSLGFVSVRVWSPQTLALCLPSAPPLAHPRLEKYGGARYAAPHPYP